jgi:hemoglobin
MKQQDILNLEDIQLLVNTFYAKVRADQTLANIFNDRIENRWPEHLEKMYRFWQTILLGEHTYFGAPFPPHSNLPVENLHFQRWLELFHEAVDELFAGQKAQEAKWRSIRMAAMFEYEMEAGRKTA